MPAHTRYCILMPTLLLLALIACQSQSVLVEGSTSGTVAVTSDSHDDHHSHDSHDSHDDHDDHAGHDHGGHDDHDSHGHGFGEVDAMKLMSLIVITVVAWIVDVLVLAFPKISQHKRVISIVSCFGGGMFGVIAVAHLLAEGAHIFAAHYKEQAAHGHAGADEVVERFRPAEMISLVGYFVMLFMKRGLFNPKTQEETEGEKEKEKDGEESATTGAAATQEEHTVASSGPAWPDKKEGDQVDDEETRKKQQGENVGLAVLFSTLMVHGIAEGLALGLQHTTAGVIVIFVAIIAHHWAADLIFTFATGKMLKKVEQPPAASPTAMVPVGTPDASESSSPVSDNAVPLTEPRLSLGLRVFLSFLCSSNVGIGIGIGWGLAAVLPSIVTGYVVSFCAGTFFFFSFSEIVPQEMPEGTGRRLPELLAFFLGMGVIYATLAGAYAPEAHDH